MDEDELNEELAALQAEARRRLEGQSPETSPEPAPGEPARGPSPLDPRAEAEPTEAAASAARSPARVGLSFLVATVAIVLLHQVSWGRYVLYPFALLGTWAHEMGHGLTGLLLGGEFEKLVLYPSLGGTAFVLSPGWARPFVSAGGLLGPAIVGGVLIVIGARERVAHWALAALSIALWISLLGWVRNPFGVAAVASLALATGACARWAPRAARVFLAQVVGITLCVASLNSLDYMFTKSFERDGQTLFSDTENIARAIPLPLPYWFYGALIATLSFAILLASFYWAWIRPWRKSSSASKAAARAESPPETGPAELAPAP